ncbi:MAG: hypothetical protein WCA49_12580 [Candidatus Sulfotelmatobacter sp.]
MEERSTIHYNFHQIIVPSEGNHSSGKHIPGADGLRSFTREHDVSRSHCNAHSFATITMCQWDLKKDVSAGNPANHYSEMFIRSHYFSVKHILEPGHLSNALMTRRIHYVLRRSTSQNFAVL